MNSKFIESIFIDYLKTDKAQYAILINGSWGCGKTYFWKFVLDDIAEKNNFKRIYISLNGISTINALDHQLFIKLLPYINNQENKIVKNVTALLGNVINKVSDKLLNTSISDLLKGVSIDSYNFSKYVICFDDLERCQIPIKEVLGFINNFVEHKNLKTIILADEINIDTKQAGYDNIKEKVVGRIINYKPNISLILPKLIEKYKTGNVEFFIFLNSQIEVLVGILEEYKEDNLRIIGYYLDVLEKTFPYLKTKDSQHIQELILFSAIISIEFKRGFLNSNDFKDPKGIDLINEHYYSLYIARTKNNLGKEETEKEKKYSEVFYEKYLEKRVKNYFFYPSLYSYILSGYLNKEALEIEINGRQPELISREIQDFRNLLHYKFRELSDEDFKRLTKSILQYALEGKYIIYDYVAIADFFYFFSDHNLIEESNEEIYEILNRGLEIAKMKKEINDRVLENLLHFGDANPKTTQMKQIVKAIHNEIKQEEYVANGNELIDSLVTKDELALTEIFDKHKLSKELFQYIDDKKFFDAILKITNKQLFNFTELIFQRYNISNIGEYLFEDINCLIKLKGELSNYLSTIDDIEQLRRYLLSTLLQNLNLIINHLNKTKKIPELTD
jgi:hypothetical protein